MLAPGEVLVREGDVSADVHVVRRGAHGARRDRDRGLSGAVLESGLAFFPEEAAALTAEAVRRLDRTMLVNIFTAASGPLPPDVAAEIVEAAEWVRLRAGEGLFREGDPSDAAYIVLGGRIAVERSAPDGALDLVGEVGPGGFVGEPGIIDSGPHTAGVRACRGSTVVRIGREAFERLLGRRTFGDTDIADLRLPFVCVSPNLARSPVEAHRAGPVARALRASVAILGVVPPVPDGDDLLVDGGVLDNLPVDSLRTSPGTIVAVDVAPNAGPRADHDLGLSVSGWKALRSRMRGRAGYPGAVALILRSMITASVRERDRQVAGGAVDLYLDLRGVGMLDFDSVEAVARRGYVAARPRIEAWVAGR